MSVITAVEFDGEIAISCDTQITADGNILGVDHNKDASKIVVHNGNHFGFSGWFCMLSIFKKVLTDKFKGLEEIKTTEEWFDFFMELHKILKTDYFLHTGSNDQNQPVESSQLRVLIANQYGIWTVEDYRDVVKHSKFWAIGCGDEYALGAMETAWNSYHKDSYCDLPYSAKCVARVGAEAACKFDLHCGLPVYTYEIEAHDQTN